MYVGISRGEEHFITQNVFHFGPSRTGDLFFFCKGRIAKCMVFNWKPTEQQMKKSTFLFLPIVLFGIVANAGAEPDYSRLSNDNLLSSDKPILSVADAQQAIDHNVLSCQTDNTVGSRIDKLTVCELVKTPAPTGSRYKFVLSSDGLYSMFCVASAGCTVPPSVASNLSSLQRLHPRTN